MVYYSNNFLQRIASVHYLIFLLVIQLATLCSSGFAQPNITLRQQDSLALVALYNATDGDRWLTNENWLSGPLDAWYGVGITANRVSSLRLAEDSLKGSLPSALGNLTNLTYLDLSGNQLTGSIPAELGNLINLNRLYLHRNQLTGSIPATLGNLEPLLDLFLFRNQLTGSIPAALGRLAHLEELWLFINKLGGNLPPELGNLANLKTLWVSDNQLTGTIPPQLGELRSLSKLFLYRNRLTGNLPPELGNLHSLTELRLYGNFFTGSIAPQLAAMDSLEKVSLHDNQFSFDDLLPGLTHSYEFYYNPQRVLGESDTIALNTGEDYTVDLSIDEGLNSNVYRWYQNHEFLSETTQPSISLTNVDPSASGVYHCVITNPAIDDFALLTSPLYVTVDGAIRCSAPFLPSGTYNARSQSAIADQSYDELTITNILESEWIVEGFGQEVVFTDSCPTFITTMGERLYGYPLTFWHPDNEELVMYWLEDLESDTNTSFTVLTITRFTLIAPDDTDNDAPTIIRNDSPDYYDITSDQDVVLKVLAEDDEGISEYKLYYAGLTTQDFEADKTEESLVIANNAYIYLFTSDNIRQIDDPLGIRYTLAFEDASGNRASEAGEIYWSYPREAFSARSDRVGPWREVEDQPNPSPSDYNIIAFPFDSQRVTEVLEELGDPDATQWRLFGYDAGNDQASFIEYGETSFAVGSHFVPGRGYFLIMRDADIRFGGQIARMDEKDGTYTHQLTLKPGWNLLGNPFPFAIDWNKVISDVKNSPMKGSLLRLERIAGTDSDYQPSEELDAFEGAFLHWEGPDEALLYLSPAARQTSGTDSRTADRRPTKGWELPIVLEQGTFRSSRAGVGMRPTATEDIDKYDALSVPRPQLQAEFRISHEANALNRSVVPEQESYIWLAEMVGTEASEVHLRWDSQLATDLPQALYLWDAHYARLLDMREQSTYRFTMPSSGTLPLQIYYGTQEHLWPSPEVSQTTVGTPYPNPVGTLVTLPLTFPAGHQNQRDVMVTLTNAQGQPVGRHTFPGLPAGYHELTLDLSGLSSGLYHYQLRVLTSEPQVVTGNVIKQ